MGLDLWPTMRNQHHTTSRECLESVRVMTNRNPLSLAESLFLVSSNGFVVIGSSGGGGSSGNGVGMVRRRIPGAQFVEDVEKYLSQLGLDANSALAFLQERPQQFKLVEMKLLAQQRDLQAKIPDIEKCLDVVATLKAKKNTGEALIADFEFSEGIYLRARVEDAESVFMALSKCHAGATSLLQKNLEIAKASLEVLVGDQQFLRDQVTITQVTIARVYNWDVHQRRIQQATTAKVSLSKNFI